MRKILLAAIFLLAARRLPTAEDGTGKAAFLPQLIFVSNRSDFPQGKPSSPPKTCSEVFPAPQNVQKWTKCREKDVTECGGPSECACNVDERLVTYTCAEGTYRTCEEDSSCHPDSPSL
jgi:hypothetical protein